MEQIIEINQEPGTVFSGDNPPALKMSFIEEFRVTGADGAGVVNITQAYIKL